MLINIEIEHAGCFWAADQMEDILKDAEEYFFRNCPFICMSVGTTVHYRKDYRKG